MDCGIDTEYVSVGCSCGKGLGKILRVTCELDVTNKICHSLPLSDRVAGYSGRIKFSDGTDRRIGCPREKYLKIGVEFVPVKRPRRPNIKSALGNIPIFFSLELNDLKMKPGRETEGVVRR